MRRLRREDWPERLAALVEERRNTPFAWGTQDCVMFAADAVEAMTAADPLESYRGAYDTEAEADAILDGNGLGGFLAGVLGEFGAHAVRPEVAQRGDWCLVTVGNQTLAGVHVGTRVAVPGDAGLHFLPLSRITRAWAI